HSFFTAHTFPLNCLRRPYAWRKQSGAITTRVIPIGRTVCPLKFFKSLLDPFDGNGFDDVPHAPERVDQFCAIGYCGLAEPHLAVNSTHFRKDAAQAVEVADARASPRRFDSFSLRFHGLGVSQIAGEFA